MRIRSIKPEFWRSQDISALAIEDRLLFIGLWSYVDDNGVGVWDEAIIAADLFAHDLSRDPRETLARVADGLQRLAASNLIVLYTVENRSYLHICTWEQHQRIDRPNKPRLPLPTSENSKLLQPSRDPRETLATGTGEQRNRGTEEQGNNSSSGFSDENPRPAQRADVEEILDYLDQHLREAELPIPNRTKHNQSAARLLIDKDGHTVQEIKAAISWTFQDEFWRTNIRSMSKLREKWGQLKGAAQRQANRQQRASSVPLSRSDQLYMAEMQRLRTEEQTQSLQLERRQP